MRRPPGRRSEREATDNAADDVFQQPTPRPFKNDQMQGVRAVANEGVLLDAAMSERRRTTSQMTFFNSLLIDIAEQIYSPSFQHRKRCPAFLLLLVTGAGGDRDHPD